MCSASWKPFVSAESPWARGHVKAMNGRPNEKGMSISTIDGLERHACCYSNDMGSTNCNTPWKYDEVLLIVTPRVYLGIPF